MKKIIALSTALGFLTTASYATEYQIFKSYNNYVPLTLGHPETKEGWFKSSSYDEIKEDRDQRLGNMTSNFFNVVSNPQAKLDDFRDIASYLYLETYDNNLDDPIFKYFTNTIFHTHPLSQIRTLLCLYEKVYQDKGTFDAQKFCKYIWGAIQKLFPHNSLTIMSDYLSDLITLGKTNLESVSTSIDEFDLNEYYNRGIDPFTENKEENLNFYLEESRKLSGEKELSESHRNRVLNTLYDLTSGPINQTLKELHNFIIKYKRTLPDLSDTQNNQLWRVNDLIENHNYLKNLIIDLFGNFVRDEDGVISVSTDENCDIEMCKTSVIHKKLLREQLIELQIKLINNAYEHYTLLLTQYRDYGKISPETRSIEDKLYEMLTDLKFKVASRRFKKQLGDDLYNSLLNSLDGRENEQFDQGDIDIKDIGIIHEVKETKKAKKIIKVEEIKEARETKKAKKAKKTKKEKRKNPKKERSSRNHDRDYGKGEHYYYSSHLSNGQPESRYPSNGYYYQSGYPLSGQPQSGYRSNGYHYQSGYPLNGQPQSSYPVNGHYYQSDYPSYGQPQFGYRSNSNYRQSDYPSYGHPQPGYPSNSSYRQSGYPSYGQPQFGYPSNSNYRQSGYPSQGQPQSGQNNGRSSYRY